MRVVQGFDRAIMAVRDPEAARRRWTALGFVVEPTASGGIVRLDDGGIELRGAGQGIAGFLEGGEGFFGLDFVSSDPEGSRALLGERGIALPDAGAEGIPVPGDILPGMAALIRGSPAPDEAPAADRHPNGALSIRSATLCLERPRNHAEGFRAFFGAGAVVETDELLTIRAGRQTILVARPDDVPLLHPQIDMADDPVVPRLVALGLRIADADAAADTLSANGVGFTRLADGSLSVDQEDATGVLLELGDRE